MRRRQSGRRPKERERGMAHRTPLELIHIYWDQVYNEMDVELVREVCADPIIRHDPLYITPLSHDEQIERILRNKPMRPYFTHKVLHADDEYVTSVWNMVSRDGKNLELCGIEVFRARDGRFTDCWNSTYMKGLWAEEGALFDPAKLPPPPVIASPEAISADWLQRAFANGGAVETQRIATEPRITPIGHGTSNATVHVHIAYNSGHITAPRAAIAKIGGKAAAGTNAVGAFEREAKAYAFFGREPAFRTPKLYWAATDDSGLTNIVLEDLSDRSEPGDQIAGCSKDQAALVVRELARLHRAYWKSPELDRQDWLQDPRHLLPAYGKGADVIRDWLGASVTQDQYEVIDGFGRLAARWLDDKPAHRTLIHSDPRVDNVLFEKTADGQVRACLIDWQGAMAGDPQLDVAYFLSGSVSPEDRRACERALIAEHVRTIAEVDPSYTLEAALEAYRFNIVSGLWLTVVACAFIQRSDHNARLIEALVGRNVAAIRDWDGLAALG
jgi:aminoglycoside phosphotransferase (APT) family kinase protein